MRIARTLRSAIVFAALAAAQQQPAPAQQPALAAQPKPTLAPADYAQWETIGITEMSRDGRWFAYTITRVAADDELRVREVAGDATRVIPYATRPLFSRDGRWLAYGIGVSRAEQDRLQAAGEPMRAQLGLLDLRTGAAITIDDIATFEFSADAAYLAMRAYAPPNSSGSAADVIVRELATGVQVNIGNVGEFAWRDSGAVLAVTTDATNRAGNGVRLFDARTGTLRTLLSDSAEYTGLAWRKDADDLAVLRIRRDAGFEEAAHVVHAWRNASTARARAFTLDPAAHGELPAAHRIVEFRDIEWSRDGSYLSFGMRPWTRKAAPDSASKPADSARVQVWHARDVDIVPEQKMRAGIERQRTLVLLWYPEPDRVVQLNRELTEDVTLSEGSHALVVHSEPYGAERMFGPTYRDLYAVDVRSGERRLAAERVQFHYSIAPDGRYLLYVRDGHYRSYDTRTGRTTNITSSLPTSFINERDDHTITEKPPYGTGGWSADGRSALLHDRYDVWAVRLDGTGAVRLTDGAADRIVHRRVWLNPDQRTVDTAQPVYVALYGERTKQYGYGRTLPGRGFERLLLLDRMVTRLTRAEDAPVFFYRVEGFDDSPDFFAGGPRLADARQITDTNPFQSQYAWGRSRLLDFVSRAGDTLQAALLYPAHYEAGRTYPLIVFPYEITSNTIHTYTVPSEMNPYNPTVFTQDGYFVLRPDIVYRARNPGLSALDALLPAIDTVLALGVVDRERVGILGHSWGAYQTAFAVTQTDIFKAAVAGAPLTNLISMYGSIYWNAGTPDAKIFETGQARMEVPFWEDVETYIRNSPLFHVQQLNTPLLVAFGDEDGAVDWNQGVELYNAARRAGKQMILLVYEGENHSLGRKANQVDYHRRINEWFAHYLKGAPAPDWIVRGVRH